MVATGKRADVSDLEGLSDRQLARRVHHVTRRLNELADRRLNVGAAAGSIGADGGLDPVATMEHNRRLDRDGGRADLERELAMLNEETTPREYSPEPETASRARRTVSAVLIAGVAALAIFGVAILSDEDAAESIPVDQWQPANTFLIARGEEPYDLRMQVACWPEVEVESVTETTREVRISLIRRGSLDQANSGVRNCIVMVRLRDDLGDRIVIDATRDKEVTVTG